MPLRNNWGKMSASQKFHFGLGGTLLVSIVGAVVHELIWPTPTEEETQAEDDEQYIVLTKMDNFPLFLEHKKIIPFDCAIVAEQASELEESDVVGKVVVADRQPPMWLAIAAKKVIIVPLSFEQSQRRKEASILEIERAAGTPEIFRTNKLT